MARYTPERIAAIRDHLSELDRRGGPVADFAREIGVSAWTIYCWKRRFAGGDRVRASGSRPATHDEGRADLVEIRTVPSTSAIEVHSGDVVVRIPAGTSTEAVRAVLAAVKAC